MSQSPGILSIQALSVGSLSDVHLDVRPGEVVCLSGPSGSGKSRLLRAVADLEAHGGQVSHDGRSQGSLAAHEWRRRVMMVPAESQWWFDQVGAHFPDDLPEADLHALGFVSEVTGWSVSRLSSGERQRLALLRALVSGPSAILLDEPTSNLDPERTLATEDWLRRCIHQRRLCALWVAHDPAQIERVADRHVRVTDHGLEVVSWA
ncbi:ABC transporter ATP-binding protein [Marinobacter sp. JSM 1782161]|uniref:ABC transporter ATP-binding protein n=1 Tax=Marinobacter sp. JSM 1782161 TaxID=2685906 RepID=UPI001403C0CD|nr:ATP-binding cassette domain-containing protein [Marinobacter sp. JSM 1782161]